MIEQVDKLLEDFQTKHSQFQIDNFIVGNAGDDWACYKQALRELAGRKNNLITLKERLEISDLGPSIIKKFIRAFRRKPLRQIDANRNARARAELVSQIAETERELSRFLELARRLKRKFESLSEADRAELEAKSWLAKARRLAFVDSIINHGQPTKQTVEFILALPKDMQAEALGDFGLKLIKQEKGTK